MSGGVCADFSRTCAGCEEIIPLPAFLMKLIEKLKKTVEDTGEQKTN